MNICCITSHSSKCLQLLKENNKVGGTGLYLVFHQVALKSDFHFALLFFTEISLKLKKKKKKSLKNILSGTGNLKPYHPEKKNVTRVRLKREEMNNNNNNKMGLFQDYLGNFLYRLIRLIREGGFN